MIKPGDCFKTVTKTNMDVFGTVIWRVTEVGVYCPHCKGTDGVRCSMLGGTGAAARPGYPVTDCAKVMEQNMKKGISKAISQEEGERFARSALASKKPPTATKASAGTVEF